MTLSVYQRICAMWFKNIFRPLSKRMPRPRGRSGQQAADGPLFDESFLRRLERLSLQAQRTLHGKPLSGIHSSHRYLPASIFSDHRPYTSGDDLRYVDWHAYARHNDILMKLGDAEQNVDVHLLLDVSRSMAWGQPPKMRSMQRLAGALGYLSLTHGDRLNVVPFGNQPLRAFGPAQGKGRLIELLRYIEAIPLQKQTGIQRVLEQHAQRHQRGGLLVLCSDLLVYEGLSEGLRYLKPPRWQVLILHLIDPRELRPELQGSYELEDSETGQRMMVAMDAQTMATYRRMVTTWQETISRTCSRYGASYARVLTTWPLEQRIVPYLRARRLLV
jgi:uncharacterized protein (DUF58 family)